MSIITCLTPVGSINIQTFGSKAESLSMLSSLGLQVPPWMVIPSTAFVEHIPSDISQQSSQDVTEFIKNIKLDSSLVEQVSQWVKKNNMTDDFFAVRSSICVDETFKHTFAGQLKTSLYVPFSEIAETILSVWASPFTSSACAYRAQWGLSQESIRIAVIIQKMIDSDVSGIAMGFNPYNGSRSSVAISSTYGVNPGFNNSRIDTDQFTIDFSDTQPARISKVYEKMNKVVFNQVAGSGTTISPVPFELRSKPSLSSEQLVTLAEITRTISAHCNKPQMLDWTISHGKLFVLQSRSAVSINNIPDTTDIKRRWVSPETTALYDENVSPLTYSIIRKFNTNAYYSFCKKSFSSYNSKVTIDQCELLGYINGKIFVNQDNHDKVMSVLPFQGNNFTSIKKKYCRVNTIVSHVNLLHDFLTLTFKNNKESKNKYCIEDLEFSLKKPQQLISDLVIIESELGVLWKSLIKNEYYQKILSNNFMKSGSQSHFNKFHKTLANKKSIEIIRSLCSIVKAISKRPAIVEMIQDYDDTEVCEHLGLNSTIPPETEEISVLVIRKMILDHLRKHTNATLSKTIFEDGKFDIDPKITIKIIREYLKAGFTDTSKISCQKTERYNNKTTVEKETFSYSQRLHCKIIFSYLQRLINYRNDLNSQQSRLCGIMQQLLGAIGNTFYVEGILDNRADIELLTRDEIVDYVNGFSIFPNLKMLISIRKKESFRNKQLINFESFETYGIIYSSNTLNNQNEPHKQSISSLQGIGNGTGTIRGKVHKAENPQLVKNMEDLILVVRNSDSNWIPLLPLVKGIIIERGSILSDLTLSATLLGIPMALSVDGCVKELQSGDSVELDGFTGKVNVLAERN